MTKNTSKAIKFPSGEVYKYESMWQDDIDAGRVELLEGKAAREALRSALIDRLLQDIQPNDTITAVQTSNNPRTGTAKFKVLITEKRGGTIINITQQVSELCGMRMSKAGEIIMGGWGYSKSFQIGYSLGRALWPNGTEVPHGTRNGEPDTCGGYALHTVSL